jgi:DNA end-binding protein Ku
MTPIKQKRWCEVHDREVERDEIVKGWEVSKGEFVIVEEADLEAIMQVDDSKTIAITRFVDASEVDPVYFDRTYYLAPARDAAAQRPYVLLLRAMQETGKAGLGRFVRQGAEHLCLIRPKGDALALETLFIAEDVNSQAEIEEAVSGSEVKEAELGLAQQVIDSLEGEFDPDELTSEYRQNLKQMLEAKLDGQEIVKPEPEEEAAPVVDLMDALKKSVAEVKADKPKASKTKAASKGGSRKRVAARKSA